MIPQDKSIRINKYVQRQARKIMPQEKMDIISIKNRQSSKIIPTYVWHKRINQQTIQSPVLLPKTVWWYTAW